VDLRLSLLQGRRKTMAYQRADIAQQDIGKSIVFKVPLMWLSSIGNTDHEQKSIRFTPVGTSPCSLARATKKIAGSTGPALAGLRPRDRA
jgi:hypothetical protein